MTWKEVKEVIEQAGVLDDDAIQWIDLVQPAEGCVLITRTAGGNVMIEDDRLGENRLYLKLRLTGEQARKLWFVLIDHEDRGPAGEGWRSPEMEQITQMICPALEPAIE